MSPELGRAAFRLAVFIVVVALGLLLIVPRCTAEFVITLVSLGIGLVFSALVVLLVWVSGR